MCDVNSSTNINRSSSWMTDLMRLKRGEVDGEIRVRKEKER